MEGGRDREDVPQSTLASCIGAPSCQERVRASRHSSHLVEKHAASELAALALCEGQKTANPKTRGDPTEQDQEGRRSAGGTAETR